jgi:hypothetical protein
MIMKMVNRLLLVAVVVLTCLAIGPQALAGDGWKQVDASAPFIDRNGKARFPSCSGAPEPPFFVTPSPTEFSFFYREGDPRKLVIAFDGGGACWDTLTCLGSVVAGDPVYDPVIDETPADLDAAGGLADRDNPDNPVSEYFQVFIPYCTGDLHTGSRDTQYTLPGLGTRTIHHRGYDNVVAVLEWLIDYYTHVIGQSPTDVFVTGASAGGYGAFFAYPAIDELLPWWTRKRAFSDSANGVINQDFYNRALTPEGVWGVWENMPPQLANAFASGPDALPTALNQSLAWSYPRTRFGQYTRAFDAVQIFYLNIAKNLNSPELWADPALLLVTAFEWTVKARASMVASAFTTFNYRFYLGEGFEHTAIADNSVYTEDSAQGVRLIDWLDDMINRRFVFWSDWRNVTCFQDCIP